MNKFKEYISGIKAALKGNKSSNFSTSFPKEFINFQNYDVYKSFAYACINARAENICKAKLYLYSNGSELNEHPVLDLIKKSNKRNQTFTEMLFKIAASLDLYGNAYLYIQRTKRGFPSSLFHIPSNNIQINLNSGFTEIENYSYTSNYGTVIYPKKNIIHFLIPDPDNSFEGKPTIDGFNMTLEIDYLQNLYQRNFYRNGAAPGLVIELDRELMDTEFERFREKFRGLYEGNQNTGKTLFLDGGAKAKPIQSYPKDVEILQSRVWIRDEIMSIFRVPKIILGVTTDVNRANAVQQLRTFNDNVIKPFAKLTIESKLNSFLQENYPAEDLKITMEYDFENERELQLKAYDLYMKYKIATREEVREMEGFSSNNK